MQMKQHATNLLGGKASGASENLAQRTNPNRLRVHYLKRFRQASKDAANLLSKAQGAVDEASLIEIEGYKAQMDAISNMERFQHEQAINDLLKAIMIYKHISQQ